MPGLTLTGRMPVHRVPLAACVDQTGPVSLLPLKLGHSHRLRRNDARLLRDRVKRRGTVACFYGDLMAPNKVSRCFFRLSNVIESYVEDHIQ